MGSLDTPPDWDQFVGGTPIQDDNGGPYTVSEHLLWAPRKVRVACIGAGASGIMMCYKKEKEFGDSMDLVVYERWNIPRPYRTWPPSNADMSLL